jgi:hypothetical protein
MASGTRSQALTLYYINYSWNRPSKQSQENGGGEQSRENGEVEQSWECGMSTDKELYDMIKRNEDEFPKDRKAGDLSFKTGEPTIYREEEHRGIMNTEPHGGVEKTKRGHVISKKRKHFLC